MIQAIKQYWYLAGVIALYPILALFTPQRIGVALTVTWNTIATVALIILSVFVLIGLVQVWMKEETIAKSLGEGSGNKAYFISAFFGSLMVGPLFALFPLLKSLLDKGARLSVITVMLTTWAVKIPMLPLEVKFLGPYFALLRVVLVIMLAIPVSIVIERIVKAGAVHIADGPSRDRIFEPATEYSNEAVPGLPIEPATKAAN